jgi:hypothetical protein
VANITELYEALDDLDENARATAEDFSKTGDLTALIGRLNALGSDAYTLAQAADTISGALKLDGIAPAPSRAG